MSERRLRGVARATLVDVAREAGCSVSLASIVMRGVPGASDESRARVMAAAERIGYRPDQRARTLRRKHSGLIGVTFGIFQPFHAEIVDGLYTAAGKTDFALALSAVGHDSDEWRAADALLRQRCEALVMVAPDLSEARLTQLAAECPIIVVARKIESSLVDVVRIDDTLGEQLAVEHLIEKGHRRITHVNGGSAAGSADRVRGYRVAMDEHGLGDLVDVVRGGLEEEDGVRAAKALLAREEGPTAVTVFNDRCATGLVNMFAAAGTAIPAGLSVVGFDDSMRARTALVPLTTISQDTALMARTAFERAVGLARGKFLPGERVLAPHLVERDSVCPPAGL